MRRHARRDGDGRALGCTPGAAARHPMTCTRPADVLVETPAVRWRVRRAGTPGRPVLLLLHGTGTALDSWTPLLPHLAPRFDLVVPDLPGHARSRVHHPVALSLPGMAAALADLLARLDAPPALVAGHSAGAPLGLELARRLPAPPRGLVGIDPAFHVGVPFQGTALWAPIARVATSRRLARWLARRLARPGALDRLVAATRSALPPGSLATYAALARSPRHVHCCLAMMAAWDLESLARAIPALRLPVLLLAGEHDPWFPPRHVARAAAHFRSATSEVIAGTGHFSHEEQPAEVAARLLAFAARLGLA